MTRTTDEWAALLDGTTEAPWNAGVGEIYGPYYVDVIVAETEMRGSGYMSYEVPLLAGERLDRDLPLAAAAPEAVAEVIRLRREVSAFRDKMAKSAEKHKAIYDRDRYLDHLLDAECDWEIASILNRILNGDNDD